MDFNPNELKRMAAQVVARFLTNKTPMSEATADIAKDRSLNSEQIKRLIEISNQVAYLKLLEKATDRTFEFPLASFEEVMAILATPDETMSKEASHKRSPMDIVNSEPELEKAASEVEDEEGFLKRASTQEKVAMLNKEMYRAKGKLEKLAFEEQVVLRDLLTRAVELREDEQFMDKVAFVVEEEDTSILTKISHLVYGEKRSYNTDELFYDSDVEDAREYVELFKQASEMVEERRSLEKDIARTEEYFQKKAFAAKAVEVAKKTYDSGKQLAGKATTKAPEVGSKAMKAGESGTFLLDNMRKPKRDVWKSIRG